MDVCYYIIYDTFLSVYYELLFVHNCNYIPPHQFKKVYFCMNVNALYMQADDRYIDDGLEVHCNFATQVQLWFFYINMHLAVVLQYVYVNFYVFMCANILFFSIQQSFCNIFLLYTLAFSSLFRHVGTWYMYL